MVEFIYTDTLFARLDPSSPLPAELVAAAKEYGLPRLEAMCRRAIFTARGDLSDDDDDDDDEDDEEGKGDGKRDTTGSEGGEGNEAKNGKADADALARTEARARAKAARRAARLLVPASTLSYDLSGALGDRMFADVCFVTEGGQAAGGGEYDDDNVGGEGGSSRSSGRRNEVYAHRCVLEARSQYFAAMFRSGMSEATEAAGPARMAEVVVPDDHVVMLRVLLYLYSGPVSRVSRVS